MKKKTVISVVVTVIAIVLAVYILFPFYLVLMNSLKMPMILWQIPLHLQERVFHSG